MHECLVQVSGNIHVALGKSVRRDGKLVHEFNIEDIGKLAASTAEMCDLLRGSDSGPSAESAAARVLSCTQCLAPSKACGPVAVNR